MHVINFNWHWNCVRRVRKRSGANRHDCFRLRSDGMRLGSIVWLLGDVNVTKHYQPRQGTIQRNESCAFSVRLSDGIVVAMHGLKSVPERSATADAATKIIPQNRQLMPSETMRKRWRRISHTNIQPTKKLPTKQSIKLRLLYNIISSLHAKAQNERNDTNVMWCGCDALRTRLLTFV